MIEPEKHKIPTRLDDKGKFLFFDYDVSVLFLMPVLVGFAINYWLGGVGILIGFAIAMTYKSFKMGRHDGVVTHLSFWKIGMPKPKKIPESSKRDFYG